MSFQEEDDDDEHLAYGEYDSSQTDGQGGLQKGFLNDAWRRFRPSGNEHEVHQQHDAALAVSNISQF